MQILSDASSSKSRGSKGHDGRAADPHGEPNGSGFTQLYNGSRPRLLMFNPVWANVCVNFLST